jgi:uncharacterized protein
MEKKHFIYVLKLLPQYHDRGAWTANTEKIIGEHLQYLLALAEKGVVKYVGRTSFAPGHPDLFGLSVLEADSEEEALEYMLNDPTVRNEVMEARLFPYNLVV